MPTRIARGRLEPRKAPRQLRSTRMVEAIVEAAARILETRGLAGFNTNAVAERAGVSVGSLYQYFPSKEALYVAVLERTLKLWYEAIPHATPGVTPQAFLKQYIRAKLAFSKMHPRLSRIFANEALNGAPVIRAHIKTEMAAALDTLVTLVKGWRSAGAIRAIDPMHLVFMIWAMTQHYADAAAQLEILLGKRQLDDADFRAAEQTIVRLVFGALGIEDSAGKA